MRLFTIETPEKALVPAVQLGERWLVAVPTLLGDGGPTTISEALVRQDEIRTALHGLDEQAIAQLVSQLASLDSVRVGPACDRGVLLVCTGANYRSHNVEMDTEGKLLTRPSTFVKSSSAIIGSGCDIVLPRAFPDMVDYEGEICIVFGRVCHDVTEEDAMSYVGGFTILNDVSARDAVPALRAATTPAEGMAGMGDLVELKQLPTFAPVGPAVVTSDEIEDVADMRLITRVNGEVRQNAITADLIFTMPQLIAEASRHYLFRPGDILSTGTPAGVGYSRTPPAFLQPGDVVTVEVPGIGTLENRVSSRGE